MTSPTPNQEAPAANKKTLRRDLKRNPTMIGLNDEMRKLKPQTCMFPLHIFSCFLLYLVYSCTMMVNGLRRCYYYQNINRHL